ncbi:MAG: D-aminoacylase, partial [Ginsengibacter sp.]
MKKITILVLITFAFAACNTNSKNRFDTIIRKGTIYDGNGGNPYVADIAINADTIAFIGDLKSATAENEIDAKGKAIAPGFINMLSWANELLIADGNSQSDIRQGVTLEVMGEGTSMGPLNANMKAEMQNDHHYKIAWNTLGEYLSFLEKKGVSCNIASFIGAGTIREYVVGKDNREATPAELNRMKLLVKQAMQEGAMGIGSSLIYPPGNFANTDELIAICKEASKYGGMYISHMRSEGNKLNEAVDELITIAKEANIPAEIYHLKAAGKNNWNKMDAVIKKVEDARTAGINITADMYTYVAGETGLTSCLPPTLQDGGFDKLWLRLQDTAIRSQMKIAMNTNAQDWENLYYATGSPDKILLLDFKKDSLKKYSGKSLAEVASIRGTSPEETVMDLIVQDSTRVGAAYFFINEENIKKQLSLPWVSFGSDEGSYTAEGSFLLSNPHPRAYGNFIRVIGHYSRDEKILPLQQAIYKLSKLPATNLKLQ